MRPKRLQAQQARLLNFLLINQGRLMFHDEIAAYVWRGCRLPPKPMQAIRQMVYELRAFGWPIDNSWNRGYAIWWQRSIEQDEQRMAA
jgi:DNA-binding winged helix-turn-helix (wHTH) protein